MKLTYYIGATPNFGDDLNAWLWPKLLPDFFDADDSTIFLGIGSIIGHGHLGEFRPEQKKIVFGCGFVPTYSSHAPNIKGRDWDVFFVRGPRTARLLGIDETLGIGDAATLLRVIVPPVKTLGQRVSFIPHWESLERGHWSEVCNLAGVDLIDPRRPVDEVLTAIQESRLVLAEAMHGAIVADALRVPWVPLLPLNPSHRDKWLDWGDSLGMRLPRTRLWPSSLLEARLSVLRGPIERLPFKALLERGLTHAAAIRLRKLTQAPPCLSNDAAIEGATARMVQKLELLKDRYGGAA